MSVVMHSGITAGNRKVSHGLSTVLTHLDQGLLAAVLLLMAVGACMVGSASMSSILTPALSESDYFIKHISAIGISLVFGMLVLKVPSHSWKAVSLLMLAVALIMLVMVFVPGVGKTVNGATRWLSIGGANFQPSEFAKLAFIIYLSGFVVRHHDSLTKSIKICIMPAIFLMFMTALLLKEPDFGSAAVLLGLTLTMLFIGGVRISQILLVVSGCVALFGAIAVLEPYRVKRLTGFLDPWAVQFDTGYQLVQALIAVGRGEWLGVGYGASIQKLMYLPEAHTDFLFAIFAEEFGFVGVVLLVLCFLYIGCKGFQIALRAIDQQKYFAGYLVAGIISWFTFQAFINMGVNLGILPTKGLTLPFMSYGRSSLLIMTIAIAIVLRVSYEVNISRLGAEKTTSRSAV